jgi:Transposase
VAQERRQYSREFKLMALSRMEEAGNVEALAEELGVRREMLYVWRFMVTLYSIPKSLSGNIMWDCIVFAA